LRNSARNPVSTSGGGGPSGRLGFLSGDGVTLSIMGAMVDSLIAGCGMVDASAPACKKAWRV
jgi:hypothetical protein